MSARLSIALLATILCALWPQGVVVCTGEDGHIELELSGAPCCPDEPVDGTDCESCTDHLAPDFTVAPVAAALPQSIPTRHLIDPGAEAPLASPGDAVTPKTPVASLRSVVILV